MEYTRPSLRASTDFGGDFLAYHSAPQQQLDLSLATGPTSGRAHLEPLAHRSICTIPRVKIQGGYAIGDVPITGAPTWRPRSRVFWRSLDGPDRASHASDGPTTTPASYIARLLGPSVSSFFQRSKSSRIVSSRLFSSLLPSPQPSFPTRFQRSQPTPPSGSRDGGGAAQPQPQPPAPASGGEGGGGGAAAGAGEGHEAEVPGLRPGGGGAGRGVPRGALRPRQGPRRPAPPQRRRRRVHRQGRRRPRLRPLRRPAPRRPRLRRPQGGRHGARGGQAPPGRAEGGVGACLRGGAGRAGAGARAGGRGAAVGREGLGPRGARQGGARGAGRVRPRGARGEGPVCAVRARGGAPGRLRLALAQRPAGVPARRADRRAHRRALGREVQPGGRRRGRAGLHGGQVPPCHPHRAHRQGVLVVAGGRAAGRVPVVCVCSSFTLMMMGVRWTGGDPSNCSTE